jgi:tetratricopeptide (TPR) repeat protein
MSQTDRLEALLDHWEASRRQGRNLAPEELCRDCPELLPELRARIVDLLRVGKLVRQLPAAGQPVAKPGVQEPAALAGKAGPGGPKATTAFDRATVDLESVTVVGPPSSPATLPQRAGRYQIQEKIAEGGMGVVLRVRDPDFDRTLAVKVMLPILVGQADAVKRFLKEARITGQLQHPGIPPVHELGNLDNGLPFFAMKLIKGQTLAALLKDRQPMTFAPRLIGIFRQVCQTIGYAHSRGIIHRDLKPHNVMVGAFGEVQVMDWGLAKVIARLAEEDPARPEPSSTFHSVRQGHDSTLSQTGDVMGTLGYMPPEQARGEIRTLDERSDVFGLGAILCEILTGRPPFWKGSSLDRRLEAADGQLNEAFACLDGCGADAELVALAKHCLAPRKADRPRHAGQVAEAVESYEAQVQERLRQAELTRQKAQVQAEEERKRHQVEQARAAAERGRRRVTIVAAAAVVLLAFGASAAVLWYQQNQAARASRHEQLEQDLAAASQQARRLRGALHARLTSSGGVFGLVNQPGEWQQLINAAREALLRAKDLEKAAESPLAPELHEEIRALEELLKQDEADREIALSLEKIREDNYILVGGEFDRAGAAKRYAKAFQKIGVSLELGRQSKEADLVRRSLVKEQLLLMLDEWAFFAVVLDQKDLAQRLLILTRMADPDPWKNKFRDLASRADAAAVEALARDALADKATLAQLSPWMLAWLGKLLPETGGEAERWLRQAQAYYPTDFWINLLVANTVFKVQPQQAEGFYRAALSVRPKSAAAWNNLGMALRERKDLAGATWAFREAVRFDPGFARGWLHLSLTLSEQNDTAGAMQAIRKSLDIEPRNALTWNGLGRLLLGQKDTVGAEQAFRNALGIDPRNVVAWTNLGAALLDEHKPAEAAQAHRKALEIDSRYATAWYNLGVTLVAQKDRPGAIQAYRKALDIDPRLFEAWSNLGTALRKQKDPMGAVEACRKALDIDPKNAKEWYKMGLALLEQNDVPGAVQAHSMALQFDPNYAPAWHNLGLALVQQNNLAGAAQAHRMAIRFDPNYAEAHGALGVVLVAQGHFGAAKESMLQALKLFQPDHPLQAAAQRQLQRCEHLLALHERLEPVLQGAQTTTAERLQLANLCRRYLRRYRDAVRLYATAFAAEPRRTDDLNKGLRYQFASCAALAAAGQGHGSNTLEQDEKSQLRRQALTWLRADLDLYRKKVVPDSGTAKPEKQQKGLLSQLSQPSAGGHPADVLWVMDRLIHWQADPDLSSVRKDKELARLPAEEQKEWRRLWSDVRALEKESRTAFIETRHPGALVADTAEQVHEVNLIAGKTYAIDLQSTRSDVLLRLEDSQGKTLDENNNIHPGLTVAVRVFFTPRQDGVYRLVATIRGGQGTRAYTLRIREFVSPKKK